MDVLFSKLFEKIAPDYTFTDYKFIFDDNNRLSSIKLCGLKEVEFDIIEII